MKNKLDRKTKIMGFTLIELLIVVSIISLLSSMVFAALGTARTRGRDAQRIRNIEEIHTAIELYILANKYAPDLGNSNCRIPGSVTGAGCSALDNTAKWITQ